MAQPVNWPMRSRELNSATKQAGVDSQGRIAGQYA
jgi:hypothetical protein